MILIHCLGDNNDIIIKHRECYNNEVEKLNTVFANNRK